MGVSWGKVWLKLEKEASFTFRAYQSAVVFRSTCDVPDL